ncbi:hypothetical protein [Amycolatopsis orientalis]|uniref:hypothetical protein n=1 Tax=Amycolatopsis orientalis TaxID=31958 RepID=UPI000697D1F2|nr:hypothetical protein [Amycolatopsis orientalis]
MIFAKRKSVAEALQETLESRGFAVDVLVEALVRVDKSGDASEIAAAFALITETPALVSLIDDYCRPAYWTSSHYPRVLNEIADRLKARRTGPLTTVIAASHGDGRVRELAVRRLLEDPRPEQLPFLLLRMTDWAEPVRDLARAGVIALLHDRTATFLVVAAETMLHLRRRQRGEFGVKQLYAAAYDAPDDVLGKLSRSVSPAAQRFLFEVRTRRGDLTLDDLVRLALRNIDKSIRARAGDAAARDAVWTGRVDVLRKLAACRHDEVRISALTGLSRLGHLDEIVTLLDDRSTLIRALARDAARRTGVDAVARYRAIVAAPAERPSLGAIAGLAESGRAEDGPLLYPLLRHPMAKVRAYAVGALRILDAVPVDLVKPMVDDPSKRVVRAALRALQTRGSAMR